MRITIIGMGLIGASLGMALRSAEAVPAIVGGTVHITGYDTSRDVLRVARERLAIDTPAKSLADAVAQADLVIIATPVLAARDILAQLAPVLPQGVVVTDVASTKAQICAWAADLLPDHVAFVGGHPMAGREQSGPAAADATLFQQAIYCLTPAVATPPYALERVETLVTMVGAKPYFIDADEHDGYVAGISHLPFLLSAALVEITGSSAGWKEMSHLAASGYRDMSRLAAGDVVMHRDICLTNRPALIRWINDMVALLLEVRTSLEADEDDQEERDKIDALFQHAKAVRDDWMNQMNQRQGQRPGEDEAISPPVERPRLFGFRMPGERK